MVHILDLFCNNVWQIAGKVGKNKLISRTLWACVCVGNVHAYFRFALLYLNWHTVKLGLKLLMRCIPYIYYEDSFAKPLFKTPFPMHAWRCAFRQLHADLNDALNVSELEISTFNNRTSQTSILRIIIVIYIETKPILLVSISHTKCIR